MASRDYIKSVQSSLHALPASVAHLDDQHEKISCSFVPSGSIDPMLLLGLRVDLHHPYPYDLSDPGATDWLVRYSAVVAAVQLGCTSLGLESQLLLKLDSSGILEFCPCSQVTVLSASKL